MKKFRVLRSDRSANAKCKIGDTVYECTSYDYGCAADDTRLNGIEHISVTYSEHGDYPFFTIPTMDLEETK